MACEEKKIYISQTSEHLGAVTPPTTRGLLRVDTENEPILPLFFHCSGCVQSVRHADFFLVHRFLFSFPTHKSRPLARSTLPVRLPAARLWGILHLFYPLAMQINRTGCVRAVCPDCRDPNRSRRSWL